MQEGINENDKYILNDLRKLLNDKKLRYIDLHNKSGLALNTIGAAVKGKPVNKSTVNNIAKVLENDPESISKRLNLKVALSDRTVNHYHRFIHTVLQAHPYCIASSSVLAGHSN